MTDINDLGLQFSAALRECNRLDLAIRSMVVQGLKGTPPYPP